MNTSTSTPFRGLAIALIALIALLAAGCADAPAPKYQPAVGNTEVLIKEPAKLAVGAFTAAPGVENRQLFMRGANEMKGGGADGTFSGYLHDAVVSELQTANRYDPHGDLLLSGVLTRNAISAGTSKGSATVGAQFTLSRDGRVCFSKTLVAHSEWPSSFIAAIAVPAVINNYPGAYQKLLGELFTDPLFQAPGCGDPHAR